MKLYSTSLNENRLKCLNRKSVKGRRTVEKNRMILDNMLKSVPNFRTYTFNTFFSILYVGSFAGFYKSFHNKRLEEFKSHFLRKTALINLKIRTDNYNRTSGIVNTFSEQVLTETSLLTTKHLGKRFERTVVRTGYGTASSAVVDKGVNSFLKHSLLVADNNVRSC